MNVFQINICPDLSTGNVMMGIADQVRKNGGKCVTASPPKGTKNYREHYIIGSMLERKIHILFGKWAGNQGLLSVSATKKLIRQIETENPDIIHLHNIHAYYLNYSMFFSYLRRSNRKVVWTFHDCWPLTGHCTHFLMSGCEKWKSGCFDCPSYREYPTSFFDRSKNMWEKKKKWFTGLPNLTIVTPSNWLAGLVKQSYLKDYPVYVIKNGISLDVFRPSDSDFRIKHQLTNKYVILGVASDWGNRKGLDVFFELAERLDDRFSIVLVGLRPEQISSIPKRIIAVPKTSDQKELAQIYSSADLFVNPTREDNYPTVNMESIACGTPVLTFRTGGSPEILDESTGVVVDCDDYSALRAEIYRIFNNRPYSVESCLKKAASYDKEKCFEEYVELYKRILGKKANQSKT